MNNSIANVSWSSADQTLLTADIDGQPIQFRKNGRFYRDYVLPWLADGNIIPDYDPPPKEPRRIGTFREFMDLFSAAEATAIFTAKAASPAIDQWLARAMGGPTMSIDHKDTATGLAVLVSAGLLTKARRIEILATDLDARSA